MKKIISIVASVVMLVSMLTIGVSAAPAGYTVSSDLLPAIQAAGALTTTGNWLGVSVSTEGITKTDALAYDFTVEGSEANTGFKIQLDGYSVEAWNLTSMIAEKHGVTLAGDKLPVGTYTGVLDVSALPALANTNGIFGMTKATVTVREFAFVTGGTSGEGGGTTPPPAGGGEGEGNEGGEGSTPVTGEEIDLGIGNTYRDGWAAISEKTSGKVVDFTGKKVTLVYNFTLVDFLSLSIRNDVAEIALAPVIAAAEGVSLGGDGGDKLPAGTYEGSVEVTGLTGTYTLGITVGYGPQPDLGYGAGATAKLVVGDAQSGGTTPPPAGGGEGEGEGEGEGGGTTPPPAGGNEGAVSAGVPLFGVINNADETAALANGNATTGGFTISGLTGWNACVAYYAREVAAFEAAAGESLYIAYDITVPADTNVQLTLNGWTGSIAAAIAGANAGQTEDGAPTIPAGTYKGYVAVTKDQVGSEGGGRVGIAGTGITVRELRLVSGVNLEGNTPGGTTPPPAGGGEGGEGNEGGEGGTPAAKVEVDLGIGNTYRDGWAAISEAVNGQAVDFTGKKVTLVYDFTIADYLSFAMRTSAGEVYFMNYIAEKHGVALGGDGGDKLPAGTYKGSVEITDLTGLVTLGVVVGYGPQPDLGFGAGATAKLVIEDGQAGGGEGGEGNEGGSVPTGDAAPIAVAGLAIASAAALYFVSRKQK